jgi:hypothetical protein
MQLKPDHPAKRHETALCNAMQCFTWQQTALACQICLLALQDTPSHAPWTGAPVLSDSTTQQRVLLLLLA